MPSTDDDPRASPTPRAIGARLFEERVRQIYSWGKNVGLLKCDNPAEGIPSLNKKGKRERFPSLTELAALFNALPRRHPFAFCAIILLILSGCRNGSIVTLTWNRVFESEGYFLYSATLQQGGQIARCAHPALHAQDL
jgi:integrase